MFYSQFILAKKGPLGTIWIAAHLERKLRKNQVADTDIGVSVDSILFPDVPIALRLSSHLLLGVVRIYSRKVNYLFHDCSEALLKVKQAFRSTAVDLPPEESTAPYHSITLPETFDLDDFELPDSDIFQGSYVDHHVSTREQITLQDTMDGVVYSTSQFGLDERFGDGDASQIGLDLDEDLFLDKVTTPRHTAVLVEVEDDLPQASAQAMSPSHDMDIDEGQDKPDDDRIAATSEIEVPVADFTTGTQVPSTSGLTEMEIPDNDHVQEDATSNLQLESECCDPTKLASEENLENNFHRPDLQTRDANKELDSSLFASRSSEADVHSLSNGENGSLSGNLQVEQVKQQGESPSTVVALDTMSSDLNGSLCSPTSVLAEQAKPISPASECLDRTNVASNNIEVAEISREGDISIKSPCPSIVNHMHTEDVSPSANALETTAVSTSEETCGRPHASGECVDANSTLASDYQPVLNIPESACTSQRDSDHVISSTRDPENCEVDTCLETEATGILNDVGFDKKLCAHNRILRACSSLQHQADGTSLGDENSAEKDMHLSSKGADPCSEETGVEEAHHASEASAVAQGEKCQTANVTDTIISEDNHAESLDRPASSELPPPEMLLSAPATVLDVQHDLLVDATPDKEALDENKSIAEWSKNLSGRKRRLMETTPVLPDGNSAKLSGLPRSKRTLDSIPDDDDLLSSILVGRKSSVLKLKSTPVVAEIASSKRQRVTTRVNVLKRKVLLDDIMVLHGDTIRQQLTNTEDIRRVRKKAPCTPPEIWMIQKQLLEDEMFSEPLFTGMTADIIGLHCGTYDLSEARFSEIDFDRFPKESTIDRHSRITDSMKEDVLQQTGEPVVIEQGGEAHEPAETAVQPENHLSEEHMINSISGGNKEQIEDQTEIPPPEVTNTGDVDTESHVSSISKIDSHTMDKNNDVGMYSNSSEKLDEPVEKVGVIMDAANDNGEEAVILTEEGLVVAEGVSVRKDGSLIQENENGDSVDVVPPRISEDQGNLGESSSFETALLNNRAEETVDGSIPMDEENTSFKSISGDTTMSTELVTETDGHAKEVSTASELGILAEHEIVVEKVRDDGGNSCSNVNSREQCQGVSVCTLEINGAAENAQLDERERTGFQDANLEMDVGGETSALDAADRNSVEFGNTMDGNKTEFLNFDDEEVDEEEEDNGLPDSAEARFLENSGWSSRTRAVAKYLQTIFEESEPKRKVIPMDNLLSGKTRKEASRMFFETLVLKTRDYIQVEQEQPFDNIKIKSRVKLMKAEF